ncbi:aspartate--tRNA(Asn) ligase [Tengunoibacter tsumagoiensis]|uniref:Aspartate--tRNA(Asp/Asn) ligase n=1 Tax=Tengunoibacter tsumagoiensis TaxID=2014871 RepID=A0A401ZVB0_9CHLR|nr:aspartate--tRNA(Asn) ligase [Tengunoibacter tsumagoiensis]GCE10849.1 aspartate--tRNA(Asp/Asn) ligase [Tengunoibacter tsumagoiensis]
MKKRILTSAIPSHVGERICISGWLQSLRQMGGITFLILRDGWGTIQAVTEHAQELAPLTEGQAGLESLLTIEGLVVSEPQAPGGVELHELHIEVVLPIQEIPPLSLNKRKISANIATLLDHAVIANRHPTRRAIFRLSAGVMASFRQTLSERHFTEIQTPKIVAASTESGANVFELDYFGRPAFLAQSPQFYKQIMVGVFERVFEVGPVFRAEKHDTTRHINEYVSLDAEMGFIEDHTTIMALLRTVLAAILAHLTENYAAELTLLGAQMPQVPEVIPQIHFADAQELIYQLHRVDVRGEPDLSPQDERWLGEWAQQEFGSAFLYVTGYPMRKRPFYTHPDPQRPEYSNSFDLLFRGIELVTGGQRLHRYDAYLAALQQAQLPIEPFEYYLEAFKYGMPAHGGFAIGSERLLMQLLGIPNVKLTTTFPRDLNRLVP